MPSQAHDGLPMLPVLGSHLPRSIPPLPQQHEESLSEEDSKTEPSESHSSDATPSAKEEAVGQPDEQSADLSSDALEEGLDDQDGELLSREEEQLQRTSSEGEELLSEKAAAEDNSGDPECGPTADITSEDLWGNDSSADDMDAEEMPAPPPQSPPASKRQNKIHKNSGSLALQEESKVAAKTAGGDKQQQQHASQNQPGKYPEQPADIKGLRGKRKPAQPVAQRVSKMVHPAKPTEEPKGRPTEPGEAGKGARQGKRKAATQAAPQAAAHAEVEPMSEVAAANAEIMRAFGGLGRSRTAFSGAPKRAQPAAERLLKAPVSVRAERQQQSRRAFEQRAAGSAAATEAAGRVDLAADMATESPAQAHRVPAQRLAAEQEGALQDKRVSEDAAEVSAESNPNQERHAAETCTPAARAEPMEREAAGMEGALQIGSPAPGPGGATSAPAPGAPQTSDPHSEPHFAAGNLKSG